MAISKEKLETLKRKVIKAFDDVPYPKGNLALYECDECREVRKIFANKIWKNMDAQILEENFDIIPLFSPEAFHYFLPAYLIYSLEHFPEKYDTTIEFTIYAVSPSKESIKNRLDYWRERFENFSSEQMNCIYKFLEFVAADENYDFFVEEVEIGKQNLKQFIDPIKKGNKKL